jgi:D-3-phosphoglycerate dehydrogenase / 2-oxoglutarate reductase
MKGKNTPLSPNRSKLNSQGTRTVARRIVATGEISPLVSAILGRFGTIEVAPKTDEATLVSLMPGTIALFVRGVTKISAAVIESAEDLLVIGRTGTGYDNIDIAAATRRGIPVVYTPGAGARSVAEGTMAMILSLLKQLPILDQKTRCGEWTIRDRAVIRDMQGLVLGIVGIGRIGREVANLAQAFEMHVIAFDPGISTKTQIPQGIKMVGFDELLRSSDVITIHAPLNERTRGMLDKQCLSSIKKGAVLVNLARGGLMESLDVIYEALNSGQLQSVGLDVYPTEPPDVTHPIFKHPNVLLTPHAMALSVKSSEAIFSMASNGMAAVLEGKIIPNVVNPEVFTAVR